MTTLLVSCLKTVGWLKYGMSGCQDWQIICIKLPVSVLFMT